MRKFYIVFVVVLTLFGCSKEVEFNDPAFQGIKNGNFFWKAASKTLSINTSGTLTITGTNNLGTLTLIVPSANVGTYTLGVDPSMVAIYQENSVLYSTNNRGTGNVVNVSDGEIVIEAIDVATQTYSGKFKFNAYDTSGQNVVNFIEGVFYKLPLTSNE